MSSLSAKDHSDKWLPLAEKVSKIAPKVPHNVGKMVGPLNLLLESLSPR